MKSFFTTNGIPFKEKDIVQDRQAYKEWRDRYHGDIVPLTVFGNDEKIVDGGDLKAIRRTLRELAPAKK